MAGTSFSLPPVSELCGPSTDVHSRAWRVRKDRLVRLGQRLQYILPGGGLTKVKLLVSFEDLR